MVNDVSVEGDGFLVSGNISQGRYVRTLQKINATGESMCVAVTGGNVNVGICTTGIVHIVNKTCRHHESVTQIGRSVGAIA